MPSNWNADPNDTVQCFLEVHKEGEKLARIIADGDEYESDTDESATVSS